MKAGSQLNFPRNYLMSIMIKMEIKARITILIILIFFMAVPLAKSQEVVKKRKYKNGLTENYFVLKENKNIKQGEALTTYVNSPGKMHIVDFGQYENNEKTGIWYYFYKNDFVNSLKAIGEYKSGKKNGYWKYFYRAGSADDDIISLLFSDLRTTVAMKPDAENHFAITVDTSDQQIQSEGMYFGDIKAGLWRYYSKTGILIQVYDHTHQKFLENHLIDPKNPPYCFLGGEERFKLLILNSIFDQSGNSSFSQSSGAIYRLDKNGDYHYLNSFGDQRFKKVTDEILSDFPREWIPLIPESDKTMEITIQVITQGTYISEFKVDINVRN